MNGITGLGPAGYQKRTCGPSGVFQTADENSLSARDTQMVHGEERLVTDDAEKRAECLERLRAAYPGVTFLAGFLKDGDDVKRFAASVGKGTFLSIAPDFLDWMSTAPEAYEEGKAFLDRVLQMMRETARPGAESMGGVVGENGEVWLWSRAEETEKKDAGLFQVTKPDPKKESDTEKFTIKRRIGYSAGRDLALLARTGTVRDVRLLISRLYARTHVIKLGADNYDKDEVKATVAQMEAVILRAKRKVKGLGEESRMDKQQKRLVQLQQKERAQRLALELKKKKAARRSREHAQIFERLVPEPLRKKDWEEERLEQETAKALEQVGAQAGAMAGAACVGATGVTMPAAEAGVTVTQVDVSV